MQKIICSNFLLFSTLKNSLFMKEFFVDNESGLIQDFKEWLEKLAPMKKDYHHHQTGEDNGFAHVKNFYNSSNS